MEAEPKIAFVQDALPFQGGAEKVLAAALDVFPKAEIFTLVYNREGFHGTIFEERSIQTSFIDRLPGAHQNHRIYLPLMPFALERFDLGSFDIILSFSYAVAHAAPSRTDQLHISYIHTPMRYAWQPVISQRTPRQPSVPDQNRLTEFLKAKLLSPFRIWELAMLNRTDHFLANSQSTASTIWKAYHRWAEVLYPPVNTGRFVPNQPRGNDYACVSRLIPLKKINLVVEAFNRLGYPLRIIGEGPERTRLEAAAKPNIQFLGWQSEAQVVELMARAKAFVHAGEEDFGIALAEAQAAGCPVIAFKRGAAPEIIQDGKTGLLFEAQNVESLCATVEDFEHRGVTYQAEQIRSNALRFDQQRFKLCLETCVSEKWEAFQHSRKINLEHSLPLSTKPLFILSEQESVYEHRN